MDECFERCVFPYPVLNGQKPISNLKKGHKQINVKKEPFVLPHRTNYTGRDASTQLLKEQKMYEIGN